MGTILFNFHDVTLWMTAMQCLFFAIILAATNETRNKGIYLLAGFLLLHAIIPLHELISWGGEFKFLIREKVPELYFIGATAYFLDGALLFLCIRAVLFEDFKFRYRQLWHLLPALFFLVFLIIAFYRLPHAVRMFLIKSERFVYADGYILADVFAKSIRIIYGFLCLWVMLQYLRFRVNTYSVLSRPDFFWLLALTCGFIVVAGLEVALSIAKMVSLNRVFDFNLFVKMGLTGYYCNFVLISLWVFTGLRFFSGFESVPKQEGFKVALDESQPEKVDPVLINAIDEGMNRHKPHLDTDLKLDQLADILGFAPKGGSAGKCLISAKIHLSYCIG